MTKKAKSISIVIIGASGFGKEVLWTIEDCIKKGENYQILGFIDDNKSLWNHSICGVEVLGGINYLKEKTNDIYCVVAIGNCRKRKEVVKKLKNIKAKFLTLVHPSVISSKYVKIGKGTIIQAGSIITVDSKIGNHVIININSTIGHDAVIQDFVTVNPGVQINGNTKIETGVDIGTGTTMKQGLKIGKWSVVGAGTALICDVEKHTLVVGVPGKTKKKL